MASLASPLGSDFQMMGAPIVAADAQAAPGYPSVNTSVNAQGSYGATFGAAGSPVIWFLVLLGAALIIYHMD